MDDAMFEGLAKGLGQGPSNASIVPSVLLNSASATQPAVYSNGSVPEGFHAEPAQVMVMVQNTRAVEAENKLAKLKSIVTLIVIALVGLCVLALWRYFRREPKAEYAGKPLPGPPLTAQGPSKHISFNPTVQPVQQQPIAQTLPLVQPLVQPLTQPLVQPVANVVKIVGTIPLWTKEDSFYDEPEPRVSESDSSIAVLVKQRETFTKDLELTMAKAQQTQNVRDD